MAVGNLYLVAANEESFWPAEFNDPAFNDWALRTTLRLVNVPSGSADSRVQGVFIAEGMPSNAWISALLFMMKLVQSKRRGAA